MTRIINELKNGITIEDYYYLLAEYDCAVVETSLSPNCRGFSIKNNEDANHVIFINSDLSNEKKIKTLIHELNHIRKDDFDKEKSIINKEYIV